MVAAVDVDSPGQHAAMAEKLNIEFPLLSDPDRSGAVGPYDLRNEVDPRELAIPATLVPLYLATDHAAPGRLARREDRRDDGLRITAPLRRGARSSSGDPRGPAPPSPPPGFP